MQCPHVPSSTEPTEKLLPNIQYNVFELNNGSANIVAHWHAENANAIVQSMAYCFLPNVYHDIKNMTDQIILVKKRVTNI